MATTYKDIMVYLDPTDGSQERLSLATALARDHGARLIGVDATTNKAVDGIWAERALRIGPSFEAALQSAGLKGEFLASEPRSPPGEGLMHCVDLIIAPRPEGEARSLIRSEIPDGPLHASGAPVLILPQDWRPAAVGENVVIAWNASREATRAVHDAMPLLAKAKKVTIFTFSPRPSELRTVSELLVDHLSHHSVASHVSDWTNTGDISAVEALFASLDTQDADLIVAGAFGHSRLFESLFGGVSLDLLRQPTIPILMSH
ncbi:MAG TPA: universal stress protein [Roseiarcus sp.]|jgi:nucleotide-binding universal stress UspA family protein